MPLAPALLIFPLSHLPSSSLLPITTRPLSHPPPPAPRNRHFPRNRTIQEKGNILLINVLTLVIKLINLLFTLASPPLPVPKAGSETLFDHPTISISVYIHISPSISRHHAIAAGLMMLKGLGIREGVSYRARGNDLLIESQWRLRGGRRLFTDHISINISNQKLATV